MKYDLVKGWVLQNVKVIFCNIMTWMLYLTSGIDYNHYILSVHLLNISKNVKNFVNESLVPRHSLIFIFCLGSTTEIMQILTIYLYVRENKYWVKNVKVQAISYRKKVVNGRDFPF